jgi:phage portal protein BeeE
MGLLQDLFQRRPASGFVASDAPTKAVTGPGAFAMTYDTPISWGRWDTSRGMARAQALSHANPWIDKAERMICGRLSAMPWHLETADDETVDDESPPQLRAIRDLLERPSPYTKPRTTWRDLVHITSRHLGVVNVAAWYLDALDANGIPREILYLNPARLTPTESGDGNWWLDKDADYHRGNPRLLTADEVLLFNLVPPDIGWAGVGLVETAESKANLSKYADRFATQTYATGGRRGSWVRPPPGGDRMPDDVFDSLVAGLKNIADSPDATKRNIVAKAPLDITAQASTPQELQAAELMSMTRDDLLLIWNVDIADAGVPGGAGLSSGQMRSQARQSTFENAIEPRADVIAESIQLLLLDRWKETGLAVELVVDKPEWEDETPAYERAAKAREIPLRNHERRAIVGLDPFGDPALDNAVWLPAGIYEAYQSPDVVTGQTQPTITVATPEVPLLTDGTDSPVKAGPLGKTRTAVESRITPKMRADVAKVLASFRATAVEKAAAKAAHLRSKPTDVDAVFNAPAFEKALTAALRPHYAGTAATVTVEAKRSIGHLNPGKAEPPSFADSVTNFVLRRGGERVVEMATTSRNDILAAIKSTISDNPGLVINELQAKLTETLGGLSTWSDERAEMIARTETMFAYNDAALGSYREYGVDEVEAIDGDEDDECRTRNGSVVDIETALATIDHPNGTLDWVPVIKASLEEPEMARNEYAELAMKALEVMATPQPAPTFIMGSEQAVKALTPQDVHVDAPDLSSIAAALQYLGERITELQPPVVNVAASPAVVNVEAPVVNVPPAEKATLPQEIRIVGMPDRQTKKAVRRDGAGNITDVGEFTTDG